VTGNVRNKSANFVAEDLHEPCNMYCTGLLKYIHAKAATAIVMRSR